MGVSVDTAAVMLDEILYHLPEGRAAASEYRIVQ